MSTFIISEVGSVHDGSFGNALKLIEASKEAGADCVKFQTHISEAETTRDAPMPPYFKGEPRFEYFKRTGFTLDQWKQMKAHADEIGIEFLSSPFSVEAVDLLEQVGVNLYKIPSGEVTNIPLLERVAATKKRVLISSGMSSWEELDRAVETVRKVHNDIVVMQCTSEYPCPYEQVGLNVIEEMKTRYDGLPVGFSDHTITIYAPIVAVARGVTYIEKHFTFSQKMYGSDARHSLEPDQFADMVQGIRATEGMLAGKVDKSSTERFTHMKDIFEKSVVAKEKLVAGTVLTEQMLAVKKPGTGIPAAKLKELYGKTLKVDVQGDQLLKEEDFV